MSQNEMLVIDEMENIKESMQALEKTLMKNHRIDPNLYVEYDVRQVKESLPD